MIPYFIYGDDFEVNNPLGSHAGFQSIFGIYYSFPTCPQKYNSTLNNIFVAAIIKTVDKRFGNDLTLINLVEKLKYLAEEGIQLQIDNNNIQVYFVLASVLGDNLGVNNLLEFASFNCNSFCRFCKRTKSETQKDTIEIPESLRNRENYETGLEINDFRTTGIHCRSILNTVPYYHVVRNMSVDAMHDVMEGICRYDMAKIILHFIEFKYFSLQTLNYRKTYFDYGEIECNLSPPLSLQKLKKNQFKMSAREMWTFVSFFGLMVGDLIPEDNEVWQFYLKLVELIDLVTSTSFSEDEVNHFTIVVFEHNEMFIKLFKQTLKPKHHFLVHYSSVIKYFGPVKYLWSFRFESKHRESKMYSNSITSRKNVPYSICLKQQFMISTRFLLCEGFSLKLEYKPSTENVCDKPYFPFISINLEEYEITSKLYFNGTTYKTGFFLAKFENDTTKFFEISDLLISTDKSVNIICLEFDVNCYLSHYNAYRIGESPVLCIR